MSAHAITDHPGPGRQRVLRITCQHGATDRPYTPRRDALAGWGLTHAVDLAIAGHLQQHVTCRCFAGVPPRLTRSDP